jgi:hypothetical protein
VVSFTPLPLYSRGKSPNTHCIWDRVPRSRSGRRGEEKFLTLPGLELRTFGRPAPSQSLYRLCYPGSNLRIGVRPLVLHGECCNALETCHGRRVWNFGTALKQSGLTHKTGEIQITVGSKDWRDNATQRNRYVSVTSSDIRWVWMEKVVPSSNVSFWFVFRRRPAPISIVNEYFRSFSQSLHSNACSVPQTRLLLLPYRFLHVIIQ